MRELASFGEDFPSDKFWPAEGIPRDMSLVASFIDGVLCVSQEQIGLGNDSFDAVHFPDLAAVVFSVKQALRDSGFALMNGGQIDLHLQNLRARPFGNYMDVCLNVNWPFVFGVTGGVRLVDFSNDRPVAYQNKLLLAEPNDMVAYQYCVEENGPSHAVAFQVPVVPTS